MFKISKLRWLEKLHPATGGNKHRDTQPEIAPHTQRYLGTHSSKWDVIPLRSQGTLQKRRQKELSVRGDGGH